MDWLQQGVQDFSRMVEDLGSPFEEDKEAAFGPLGKPGNVSRIVVFARKLVARHRKAQQWAKAVCNADVHPYYRRATYELSLFADAITRPLAAYGPNLLEQLKLAAQHPKGSVKVNAILTVDFDPTRLMEAMDQAHNNMQRDILQFSESETHRLPDQHGSCSRPIKTSTGFRRLNVGDDVVSETLNILRRLGHKKTEAQRLIEAALSTDTECKDVQSLLTAVYRHKKENPSDNQR